MKRSFYFDYLIESLSLTAFTSPHGVKPRLRYSYYLNSLFPLLFIYKKLSSPSILLILYIEDPIYKKQ